MRLRIRKAIYIAVIMLLISGCTLDTTLQKNIPNEANSNTGGLIYQHNDGYKLFYMYGDICYYRQVFLLDAGSGNSESYYLPVLDESKQIQLYDKEFEAGTCIRRLPEEEFAITVNKNIFWIRDSLTRHTIISMDFAESLLRRGVTGIELKEVVLTPKESVFSYD